MGIKYQNGAVRAVFEDEQALSDDLCGLDGGRLCAMTQRRGRERERHEGGSPSNRVGP